jgi:hypothetical protein
MSEARSGLVKQTRINELGVLRAGTYSMIWLIL